MSKYHPDWDIEPILEAAADWKEIALLGSGSILTNENLWTDEHLDELEKFYVENLDEGEGNFMSKLESQIQPTSPEAKKLMAELKWFMLLAPSNIGPENKRETIKTIWEWSGVSFPGNSAYLSDSVLSGIGSGGAAYNTHRWREVVFFIRFLRSFRALPLEERGDLLSDGWKLAEWMQSLPETDARQLRHMILYLFFPESFERIFSRSNRRKLLLAFTDLPRSQVFAMSAIQMNSEIQRIRKEFEERYGHKDIEGLRGIVWVTFDSTQAYHIEIMEIFRVSYQEKVVSFFG